MKNIKTICGDPVLFDSIVSGNRTAKTICEERDNFDFWKKIKIGDIIAWENIAGKKIKTKVIKEIHPLKGSGKTKSIWSKIEAVPIKEFDDYIMPQLDKYWQIEYELLNKKPLPGVELITDSGITIEQSNKFIDLLSPVILAAAERENVSSQSNYMFSFGKRWTRIKAVRGYWKEKFDLLFKSNNQEFSEAINKIENSNGFEKMQQWKKLLNEWIEEKFDLTIRPHNKGWSGTGFNYGYSDLDAKGNPVEPMSTIKPIIKYIEETLFIDMSDYNSVLANIYTENQFIPPHRDTTEDERANGYAIIVINLGADGAINHISDDWYQNKKNQNWDNTRPLKVSNGGIYAFGVDGIQRFQFFHGINTAEFGKITPTKPIKLPDGTELKDYRITLTFRRVTDPKLNNAPLKPKKIIL